MINEKAKTNSKAWLTLVRLGVAILLSGLILYRVDGSEAREVFRKIDIHLFALSCLIIILAQILTAVRTYLVLSAGGLRFGLLANLMIYMTGIIYSNFTPGTLGLDGYRAIRIRSKTNAPILQIAYLLLLRSADRFMRDPLFYGYRGITEY